MPFISRPLCDLEMAVPRSEVEYKVVLPSHGVGEHTGLVFYIHGWGARFNDPYACKLLPYLADTYDCVAVSVDYQGSAAQGSMSLRPAPDFFTKLKEHHGVSIEAPVGLAVMDIVKLVLEELGNSGVKSLHSECRLIKDGNAYINFGLLPALDHLQVTHAILDAFPIDRRRMFVIGTSYGGYLALLMAKFAPNTFKMTVDNCGFSGPQDSIAAIFGITGVIFPGSGVKVHAQTPIAFCAAPGSRFSFSADRRIVREIAVDAHYTLDGCGTIYSYHSEIDTVAPIEAKMKIRDVVGKYRDYDLRIIRQEDIDGMVFKNLEHGMNASIRGLFDLSYRRWVEHASAMPATTDFDIETVNILPCADKLYVISFSENGVALAIC